MLVSLLLIASALAEPSNPLTDSNVIRFRNDLEQIRLLRKETKVLYDRLAPIVNAPIPEPFSGDDLAELDAITKTHSFYAKELASFVKTGSKTALSPTISVGQATTLALELAATLTFDDSVDQVVSLFEASPKLRVILNRPNPTYDRPTDVLYETMLNYYSLTHFDRRSLLINAFLSYKKSPILQASPELVYLAEVITQSATYLKYISQTPSDRANERMLVSALRLQLQAAKASDRLEDFVTHRIVGSASKAFGNAVGSIQFRRGKMYQNPTIAARMKRILKPGDLLLEATPFRATSYFIPGHYGHVALWIGTEPELKNLGLWDADAILPYQKKIHNGASILEALRSGVEINPVEHFLDIDDLLILRPNDKISPEEVRAAILSGMTHVGQPYDFNFDVGSNDKIVCSELAFKTYTGVPFRLEQTMGRWTIDPDSVAEQGLPGGSFTPVMMVNDGKVIETDLQKALAKELGLPTSSSKPKAPRSWPKASLSDR